MKWAIDIDGVITANPAAFSFLTYHLNKNENSETVIILTWRDGSDPERRKQTMEELDIFGIYYNQVIMAPKKFDNIRAAALWKISKMKELGINIWIDDEIKMYIRDLGIDVHALLPDVHCIWI